MEKLSNRKHAVLEILDEQIDELEKKLRKVQPLIDELNQLKRTRATLLSERTTTGSVSARTRLTMEEVVHAMREAEGAVTPVSLAEKLGVDPTIVRSHLHRHRDTRYRQNGDRGTWVLIGQDNDDESDEED